MLKRKSTAGAAPAASATAPSKSSKKKAKAAPAKKLAYNMTDEELRIQVDADVKRQLAPKRPKPKEEIDPVKVKKLLEI